MYELENFKVANCLYVHPMLEKTNEESEKESLLMIYQKVLGLSQIKNNTYISIVKTVYLYYQAWDDPFIDISEKQDYLKKYEGYLSMITSSLNEEYVIMNGYNKKHSYSSDDKSIPSKTKSIQNALIYTIIVIIVVLGVLFFAKELNVQLTTIALVSVAVVFIVFSFVALSDSKAAKIIKICQCSINFLHC